MIREILECDYCLISAIVIKKGNVSIRNRLGTQREVEGLPFWKYKKGKDICPSCQEGKR